MALARFALIAAIVVTAILALTQPTAAHAGSGPVLPPQAFADCTGEVPVIVASDKAAQPDIYAAALLAASIDTDCIVLAGARGEWMPDTQVERLRTALTGGYVVGGVAAVPEWKLVQGRERIGGVDRWDTIRLIGAKVSGSSPRPTPAGSNPPASASPEVALPPQASSSCVGHMPIIVANDQQAQSDVYAAALLAAHIGTDCIVLAGARNAPMPSDQTARLNSAQSGGYVVGGNAAVPESKLRVGISRFGGADRWDTIRRIGDLTTRQAAAVDVVKGPPISLETVVEVQQSSDLSRTTILVHYCGHDNSSDTWSIAAAGNDFDNGIVQDLNTQVAGFYRTQFGNSSFSLEFQPGAILLPANMPASGTPRASITGFAEQYPDHRTPCEQELSARRGVQADDADRVPDLDATHQVDMFLADVAVSTTGTAGGVFVTGYAYSNRGAIMMAIPAQYMGLGQGSDFFTVVAHEVGHSAYNLDHPWDEQVDPVCHNIGPDGQSLGADELSAIMSYTWPNPPCNRRAVGAGAFVSCANRRLERLRWLAPGICGENSAPSVPTNVQLIAGDGELTVIWDPPGNRGDDSVTRYDVHYRSKEWLLADAWIAWPGSGTTDTSATISGLQNGTAYEVAVLARNSVGTSGYSAVKEATPRSRVAGLTTVTLRVGRSAQGLPTTDQGGTPCTATCRWLDVSVDGLEHLGPGPHNLVCAHRGVASRNYRAGWWDWKSVASFPNSDSCFFGYPGAEVYVVVGARWENGQWLGGVRSNTVRWPNCALNPQSCGDSVNRRVDIEWGGDATDQISRRTGRRLCPVGESCRNLVYWFSGLGSGPWTLECWGDSGKGAEFLWGGNPETGCLYWGSRGNAWVVVDGVESNKIRLEDRPRS